MTGRPGARFYALAQSYWDYVVTGLLLMWLVCDMVHSMRSYFTEMFYCSTHWAIELIPLP